MLGRNRMKSIRKRFQFTGESSNSHALGQVHQSHPSSSSSSGASVSELPSELIPLILVKLPIKSIIISKCVCKSWNHLISDPYFTKFYDQKSPFTAMLLLRYTTGYRELDISFLEMQNYNADHDPFNLDGALQRSKDKHFLIVGSCNGLLCLNVRPYQKRFVILINNPLTGESVMIPRVKGGGKSNHEAAYGFSATLDRDCYKLVRISWMYDYINGERRRRLDSNVITIGVDDEWRDFHDPALRYLNNTIGVALNGLLHWIYSTPDSIAIYVFDVGKEIGQCIPGPENDIQPGNPCLGVLDGQLCFTMVNKNENEHQIDLWTMRQYGVAGSWTKDIILRTSEPSQSMYAAAPITTSRNGDIFLSLFNSKVRRESFISFDPKTKNCVNLEGVFADKDMLDYLQKYTPCFSSLSGIISRQITNRDL